MLVPTPASLKRWRNNDAAIDLNELTSVEVQPPGVWQEFRWYLLGLVSLILLFGLILKFSLILKLS